MDPRNFQETIGGLIGSFVTLGVIIAFFVMLVRKLMVKIGWPKTERWRVFVACFFITALEMSGFADEPITVLLSFLAGVVVFSGYALRKPKSHKVEPFRCTQCGNGVNETQQWCTKCGTPLEPDLFTRSLNVTTDDLAYKNNETKNKSTFAEQMVRIINAGNRIKSMTMKNAKIIIITGAAIVITFILYWILFRPGMIRSECLRNPHYGSAKGRSSYDSCLILNGIQPSTIYIYDNN